MAHLFEEGLLQLDFGHTAYATNTYLRCSAAGAAHLANPKRALVMRRIVATPDGPPDTPLAEAGCGPQAPLLQQHLEAARRAAARRLGVFPHSVLTAGQLAALLAAPPVTAAALEAVIGHAKAAQFAGEILQAVRDAQSGIPVPDQAEATASTAPADEQPGPSGARQPASRQQQLQTHAIMHKMQPAARFGSSAEGSRGHGAHPPKQPAAPPAQVVVISDDSDDDFEPPRKKR